MPARNNTIDFTSPLIEYQGKPKQQVNLYDQSPFLSCDDDNCTASLHFNWTVAFFVAVCPGLSTCPNLTTTLDGGNAILQPMPKQSNNSEFQLPASTTNPHSNLKIPIQKSVHLHYFNWTSNAHSLMDATIPRSDPAFKGEIEGGNPQVTFSFAGDRVALYGPIGANGWNYNARLDGRQPWNLRGKSDVSLPNQLLFYADSLDLGNHTVTVAGMFNLDHAIVDGTLNNPTSASPPSASLSLLAIGSTNSARPTNPGLASLSLKRSGLSQAQLIGIMAAVAFLVTLLVLALVYVFWRRFRRRANLKPKSYNGFSSRPSTPQPVQTVPEAPSISLPENPPTRFYEPVNNDWTNSFYSQTTAVALDQGYSNYLKGTREAKAFSHSSADSLGSESIPSRRESADAEYVVANPRDMGTVYAV
ncbi:hypothetical protein C8F04DRAFT_631972 [Mycena alexandri]|uniref:Uncharacterized protein n=1 Tax=Mycena alexandri TaxID=1745969 RepID=A0AAD6SWQ1_9AGAR|nr:hypothetical protein C8F04DRAFT_631972 [Mycena alexandri]